MQRTKDPQPAPNDIARAAAQGSAVVRDGAVGSEGNEDAALSEHDTEGAGAACGSDGNEDAAYSEPYYGLYFIEDGGEVHGPMPWAADERVEQIQQWLEEDTFKSRCVDEETNDPRS